MALIKQQQQQQQERRTTGILNAPPRRYSAQLNSTRLDTRVEYTT